MSKNQVEPLIKAPEDTVRKVSLEQKIEKNSIESLLQDRNILYNDFEKMMQLDMEVDLFVGEEISSERIGETKNSIINKVVKEQVR